MNYISDAALDRYYYNNYYREYDDGDDYCDYEEDEGVGYGKKTD